MICPTCFTVYVQVSCPPTSSSGQLGSVNLPSSSAMSLFRRSLITWSPRFTSGNFIFNSVTAGLGMLEIGARQLDNWRLREPPDFLPFCQPGVPSNTSIHGSTPRHYSRLPGRYITQFRVNPLCKSSFLEVRLAQGGDFLGANSCAPTSSHSPWECIYLFLVPCTWPSHGSYLS